MKKLFQKFAKSLLLLVFLLSTNIANGKEIVKVDANIKSYQPVVGLGGTINSIGSDTLNNLMTLWAESFRKYYPNVFIQIEGKGSATAPPALIEGVAQFGPMSRFMKKEEINKFKKKYGFAPLPVGVALDALAVFVNKENPLTQISLPEVDAIFSSTYKGKMANVQDWEQLLPENKQWQKKLIRLYGRNSASGTYGFFKGKALFKGDFKSTVKERPGSAAVVQSVTEDKFGIGYSGMGYLTSGVKGIKLSLKKGDKGYIANYSTVISGKYPLARLLYIYVVKPPDKEMDKLVVEFLKFILSKEGQQVVIKDGYLPLNERVLGQQRALID
ncbi:MAG: phosphate ABC transporter substrate-binding protein [SAR324 cluster bacterium]|nr:phosphate ABC transporter substrate-binding protein [SAR324 cluster bacterium]